MPYGTCRTAGNTALVQSYTLLQNFMSSYENSSSALLDSVRKDLGEYMGSGSQNADSYNNFMNRINAISSNHFIETVSKDYLKTLLKIYNGNDSVSLRTTIANIANLCVFNAGPAVLEARSYVMQDSLDLVLYDWDNSCSTGNSYRLACFDEEPIINEPVVEMLKAAKHYIIPNPIGSEMRGTITLEKETKGKVTIYNATGVKVYDGHLQSGENVLNLKELSSGVYLYNIWVNGQLNNQSKLVIVQ